MIKMDIEECLNFCNLYLINSMILKTQENNPFGNQSKQKSQRHQHKNKKRKHGKFEKQNNVLRNQNCDSKSPVTPRTMKTPKSKKQRFQFPSNTPLKQERQPIVSSKNKQVKIDDLLSDLCVSTTKKAFNTFQESIGVNSFNKNSTYKKPEQLKETNWHQEEPLFPKNQTYNKELTFPFQNINEPSERSDKIRRQNLMYVPTSRTPISRLKATYGGLNFGQNKERSLTPTSIKERSRRKREKDFYKVNTSPIKKERTLSNSKSDLMSKFENEIKQDKRHNERTFFTKTESNTKFDERIQNEGEQEIVLNTKVRDALTCLSQMRTPPKPIQIQIKRT